ncbi:UNVERIFIED_CONTAM: hypothetical protein NCL1_56152 [Trichonephila clavipes]
MQRIHIASENELISNQSLSIAISHFDSLTTRSQKQLQGNALIEKTYEYQTIRKMAYNFYSNCKETEI